MQKCLFKIWSHSSDGTYLTEHQEFQAICSILSFINEQKELVAICEKQVNGTPYAMWRQIDSTDGIAAWLSQMAPSGNVIFYADEHGDLCFETRSWKDNTKVTFRELRSTITAGQLSKYLDSILDWNVAQKDMGAKIIFMMTGEPAEPVLQAIKADEFSLPMGRFMWTIASVLATEPKNNREVG